MSRKARIALTLAGLFGFAASASAQLSDDPYFNLFSSGTIYQSDVGSTQGDGTVVWLCGTETCAGTHAAGGTGFAQFSIIATQPAGSGYIDPFLRFQHNEPPGTGGSVTTEAAYNTNDGDAQGDGLQVAADGGIGFNNQAKDDTAGGSKPPTGDFNHALVLSQLVIDEQGFMTFLLDINEPQNACNGGNTNGCALTSTLRLDELEFFIATKDDLKLYQPDWATAPITGPYESPDGTVGGTFLDPGAEVLKFWDMDFEKTVDYAGNCTNSNKLACSFGGLLLDNINDGLGSAGSGDYDLQVKIPYTQQLAAFVAAQKALGKSEDQLYVYLYNFAGEAEDCGQNGNPNSDPNKRGDCGEADAGFEEWAAILDEGGGGPPEQVPVPATALLFAAGLAGLMRSRKR